MVQAQGGEHGCGPGRLIRLRVARREPDLVPGSTVRLDDVVPQDVQGLWGLVEPMIRHAPLDDGQRNLCQLDRRRDGIRRLGGRGS